MDTKKLSLKKIYLITGIGIAITAAAMLAALYILTESVAVLICGLLFTVLIAFWIAVFIYLMRKKLTVFSNGICRTLDGMMNGNIEPQKTNEEETLLAKINYRLTRLYEAMRENSHHVAEEKVALQELISDISHQVKMPIANLKIVNSTLLEQNVPENRQRYCRESSSGDIQTLLPGGRSTRLRGDRHRLISCP